MTDDLFAGVAVELETMLQAREARVERRRMILEMWLRPTISLSIVMPGPVKDCAASRYLRDVALDVLMRALDREGWSAETTEILNEAAGPEAIVTVAADPIELKRATVAIEDAHPLGRLWDLDVEAAGTGTVSRRSLGLPVRRCFVCSEPAHACARSRAHSLEELLNAMRAIVDAYRGRTSE
jgi:holo-ACP synthase